MSRFVQANKYHLQHAAVIVDEELTSLVSSLSKLISLKNGLIK